MKKLNIHIDTLLKLSCTFFTKNRCLVFLLLIFNSTNLSAQQTPLYSHYMFSSLTFNPAYAGNKDQPAIHSSFRKQWIGIEGSPQTFILSVDAPVYRQKLAIGLDVMQDQLGDFSNGHIFPSIAYRIRLTESMRLAFGIAVGIEYQLFDRSQALKDAIPDPYASHTIENQYVPDVRSGIYLSTKEFYLGFSASDLLKNDVKQNDINYLNNSSNQFFVTSGYKKIFSENMSIFPSVLYKEDFKNPSSIQATFFIQFNKIFWTGIAYRSGFNQFNYQSKNNQSKASKAICFLADVELNERIRIGYAFDYGLSTIAADLLNTHEVSLSYYFSTKKQYRIIHPRYL